MGRNNSNLDDLISTTCLIDNMLFEACRECQGPSPSLPTMQRGSGTHSSDFVTVKIQETHRKAKKDDKCGGNSHTFEDFCTGWKLQPGEKTQPELSQPLTESWREGKSTR
jgi:hypothetical protein